MRSTRGSQLMIRVYGDLNLGILGLFWDFFSDFLFFFCIGFWDFFGDFVTFFGILELFSDFGTFFRIYDFFWRLCDFLRTFGIFGGILGLFFWIFLLFLGFS